MEKLSLIPQAHEIVINNGSSDGAVDLFSYGPESQESARSLGSLYLIGHRDSDSDNMGYIVSLIASLANREYYAQPGMSQRDAFARMLRKVNEIVDEFFKSTDSDLSVGVFAIAGNSIMVSKLDKFKIVLARDGQTIDILNNVALFTKEHIDKRRFSSIISGTVQPGDRILAYYPDKSVTSRERHLKAFLTKLPYAELAAKFEDIGRQHSTFAAAALHVDIVQTSETVQSPSTQAVPAQAAPTLAWAPRQSGATAPAIQSHPVELETEQEVPHIISTEFALGTRRNRWSKLMEKVRFVRLDTRGKALFMGATALVVIGGVMVAKSYLFADPAQQKVRQTVQNIRGDLELAQTKITQNDPGEARQILMRALATLSGSDVSDDKEAKDLTASLVQTMDTLDSAQTGTVSLVASLDTKTDSLVLATWSSASNSLWAVVQDADETLAAVRISDGTAASRTALDSQLHPSILVPFGQGILVLDTATRTVVRVQDDKTKSFSIPTQDNILSAFSYEGGLYLLTDHAILKVSDLDTDKPVTKQWLTDVADLAPDAAQIYVDGNVWTLGRDGILTRYYKGKKAEQVQTTLQPSGSWQLLPAPQSTQLAVANSDTRRIYIIDMADGSLVRTVKIDTAQPVVQMLTGPDGSTLFISKDNKIWSVQ